MKNIIKKRTRVDYRYPDRPDTRMRGFPVLCIPFLPTRLAFSLKATNSQTFNQKPSLPFRFHWINLLLLVVCLFVSGFWNQFELAHRVLSHFILFTIGKERERERLSSLNYFGSAPWLGICCDSEVRELEVSGDGTIRMNRFYCEEFESGDAMVILSLRQRKIELHSLTMRSWLHS